MWNKDRVYGIYRQASGIVPKTYPTGQDYDKTEEAYRCARDSALVLIKHIEEIKTYEHGGPTYKTILEGIAKARGKTKVEDDDDLSDNMYKVGAAAFETLATKSTDSKTKDLATQIKENYLTMSKTKHAMNKKLGELIIKVRQLKKDSLDIDNERTKMKNVQFDAERLFELNKRKTNEEEARKNEDVVKKAQKYTEMKEKCQELMNKYTQDPKHYEVLQAINDIHKNFYKETASQLK